MITNPCGTTGKRLSAIGFGGMRLPDPRRPDKAIELLHAARRAGITYFDTAPFYCDDRSEDLVGEALRTMPDSPLPLYVSSKCSKPDGDGFRRSLERSLARLGLDRIAFFHLWCVMDPADWRRRVDGGALAAALRARDEGLIEHVCVSTHMRGPDVARLLDDHPEIDLVTLGYCAINFPYRREGVEAAARLRKGVVAMNPLGGGLIPQHPQAFDFIRGPGDPDVVTAALRFLVSDPAITTALVGFSAMEELEAAVNALHGFSPRPPEHLETLRAGIERGFNEMCTGCGYCLPCPQDIPIPQYMDIHNRIQLGASPGDIRDRLRLHWGLDPDGAARCIRCGLCETRCTQHLPIIQRLQAIAELRLP
jgi:predicted aldo/keto reductase-like oxidoreductase